MSLGLLAWWALGGGEPEVANAGPSPTQAVAASTAPSHAVPAPTDSAAPRRELAGASTPSTAVPAADPVPLRVRLRGLHPNAPWTAKLGLRQEGRDEPNQTWLQHDDAQVPDADGVATFPLPAWVRTATLQKGRFGGRDPNYLPLEHRFETALDLTQELVLDVQATGLLEGRVVDARGEPVPAARLSAFAYEQGAAVDRRLGVTNTGSDGSYRLRVPAELLLLLVATPMQELRISGLLVTLDEALIPDDGNVRADLLPRATRARATLGTPTTVEDLILHDAAQVRGMVTWADERPIGEARVWIHPADGASLSISDQVAVRALPNGTYAPAAVATTDAEGRFRLPGVAGLPCRLLVEAIAGTTIVGDHPSLAVTAPEQVFVRVPLPVQVRALRSGVAVPHAAIEIVQLATQLVVDGSQLPSVTSDAEGTLRIVTTLPHLRLRASAGDARSAWRSIDTERERSVELELGTRLGELAIEFQGEFPVRNTFCRWTRDDGAAGSQHLLRDDRSGPFRMFLEPGRYQVRFGPAGGERSGLFLLPVEREVEIGSVPVAMTVQGLFGGRFTVFATDSRGAYVAGTCRVLDGSGTDRTAQFVCRDGDQDQRVGAAGELLPFGPNEFGANLPPGDYLLEFGFPEHGAQQQRITIRAREVLDVRLRLP